MRIIRISILMVIIIELVSCKSTLVKDSVIDTPQVISVFQQSMLDEINLARENPAVYADLRLKMSMLDSTDNGSYNYLISLNPRSKLVFNNSLNISATNYARYLTDNNIIGHNLDGTPLKRAISVGYTGSLIAENIASSTDDSYNSNLDSHTAAISFVRLMIIDDRVADLGHRLTILNPNYKTIGIGFSRNPSTTYINYNVEDFGNQ